MKIRTKFALFTALVMLVTTFALAALAYRLQKRLIEDGLASERLAHVSGFAAVCRQALTGSNDLFMVNYVRLLQDLPGVQYAYFAEPAGRIVVHSDRAFLFRHTDDWLSAKPTDAIEMSMAVKLGGVDAGRAVLGFSRKYQEDALRSALRKTLLQGTIAAGGVAAVGLLAALLLAYRLTRPIRALADAAEAVGAGQFQTEVPVLTRDELGGLARRFNDMAQRLAILDEMKDDFIASVSHDLRSPLTAIRMYVEYMLNEDDNRDKILPEHKGYLMTVVDNALRLDVFITNILDAAKIKAGRMEYHPRPVPVQAAAENLLKLYGAVAQKRNVSLSADIPGDLPPVKADPERMDQVLSNLISNAFKFTEPGGAVTLRGRSVLDNIEITVQDTGKGIAAEDLPLLFARFGQAKVEEQRAKKIKGTGLGLSIVKRTVEDMGGQVRVESEVGRGTRFIVALPRANGEARGG